MRHRLFLALVFVACAIATGAVLFCLIEVSRGATATRIRRRIERRRADRWLALRGVRRISANRYVKDLAGTRDLTAGDIGHLLNLALFLRDHLRLGIVLELANVDPDVARGLRMLHLDAHFAAIHEAPSVAVVLDTVSPTSGQVIQRQVHRFQPPLRAGGAS